MVQKLNLTIRPIAPGEQNDARDLIQVGLAERWGILDPGRNPDLESILTHYRRGVFLVAYLGDELVGTGALLPETGSTCRIVRMSVRTDLRGRGIGSAILDELVRTARTAGYTRIVLETTAAWTDAVAFYRMRGFTSLGVRDGDHHFEREI